MPLPFETLLPFGIVTVMFAIAGGGLAATKLLSEDYKPPRYNLDRWDRQMMERDRRLTGSRRGQSDQPVAPADFKVNSVYMTERDRY